MVVLVRIDDRLIHGQVVVGWAKSLNASRIVVANDKLAEDEFQKELIGLATPAGMNILILKVNDLISQIKRGEFENGRTILLVARPVDGLRLVEGGLKIEEINVGGMRLFDDRRQVLPWVSVNEEEIDIFRRLAGLGVKVEARAVPTDRKIDLLKLLDKLPKANS